jgi:hypothetical protein
VARGLVVVKGFRRRSCNPAQMGIEILRKGTGLEAAGVLELHDIFNKVNDLRKHPFPEGTIIYLYDLISICSYLRL